MFAVLHPAIGFHTSQILSIRSIESLRVVPNQQGDKAEGLELVFFIKKCLKKHFIGSPMDLTIFQLKMSHNEGLAETTIYFGSKGFLRGRFSAQTILRHHVRNIHVDLDVPGPTKARMVIYFHIGL